MSYYPSLPAWIVQITGPDGRPLAGGTVTATTAGTSAPKPLYLDKDRTIVAPNPLTLDSFGTLPQVWPEPGYYRLVVKDSSGIQLWQRDYIAADSFEASAGLNTVNAASSSPSIVTASATTNSGVCLVTIGMASFPARTVLANAQNVSAIPQLVGFDALIGKHTHVYTIGNLGTSTPYAPLASQTEALFLITFLDGESLTEIEIPNPPSGGANYNVALYQPTNSAGLMTFTSSETWTLLSQVHGVWASDAGGQYRMSKSSGSLGIVPGWYGIFIQMSSAYVPNFWGTQALNRFANVQAIQPCTLLTGITGIPQTLTVPASQGTSMIPNVRIEVQG